jgi:hypothetical protein
MPANFVLLEKITVGAAGASSVTFSGIPQTGYTDLVVNVSARTTRTGTDISTDIGLRFNNDSGSVYSARMIEGSGSATRSTADSGTYIERIIVPTDNATSNTFSNDSIYIPNYTSSVAKSLSVDAVMENNATTSYSYLVAGLWNPASQAAITSISLTSLYSSTFEQYSSFYLYGVAKLGTTPAIVPYATGGDTIMTDGTYWYHAFLSSGTFTPAKGISCDILQIAGGGGSPQDGGGGGAGGLLAHTAQSLTTTGYTVTVGAGGTGSGTSSTNGSNSQFASLTASVGGGASVYHSSGATGGSGGGGSAFASPFAGGSGTSGQGNAGGAGGGGNFSGGGGGAGAVGTNATGSQGGNGGDGVSTYSSWGSVTGTGENVSGTYWFAGGGSGWYGATTGGKGGGGNQVNGIANTGGGAGGYNKNGGSGLVVVRYLV